MATLTETDTGSQEPPTDEVHVLDCLISCSSQEEFRKAMDELVRASADKARARRLANAGYAVLAMIEEERRHGRAIAALNDTAVDLATRLDVDEVLAAICRRSCTLLATDAAYITLSDPARGDTYVRTTRGIVTDQFRRMRLPAGVGLGGLVAAEGIPNTTSDYLADDRFMHAEGVDERVLNEGLRAIVAVPLRRGEEVIGVLMAGCRAPRHFAPSEVALFQALATHAAIAIENARLFADAARSNVELEAANASIQQRNRRVEAAAELHAELAQLVVEDASPSEVLHSIAGTVGGALSLTDSDALIATAGSTDLPDREKLEIPVTAGSERLATLWWTPESGAAMDEDQVELLHRSTLILAGQLLARQARTEADARRRGQLVADLFDRRDPDTRVLGRDAERLGVCLDASCVVIVAELEPSRWTELNAARAAADAGGAARAGDGEIVAFVRADSSAAAASDWTRILTASDGAKPTIGVSAPASGIVGLRAAYGEARNVLNVLRGLNRSGLCASAAELGLFGLIFGHSRPDELEGFLGRVLGPVLDHDARRGDGQMLATLHAYLEHQGQLRGSARTLGIHINTLYARLDRLDQLLGSDWRSPDRRLELQLALRLRSLAQNLF